jgi:hypothetical protein
MALISRRTPASKRLRFLQDLFDRRMGTRHDGVSRVFVIRVGGYFRAMRRIIVAKNQARAWTLIVVAVTEPAGFLANEDDSFADF